MKKTLYERFKSKLMKIGRKNAFLRYMVLPLLVLCLFCSHLTSYLRNNTKRLSFVFLTMLVFVIYSSFSFPLFISGSSQQESSLLDGEQTVFLAYEKDIDLDNIQLLDDEDVLEDNEELDLSHGLTVDKFDVE